MNQLVVHQVMLFNEDTYVVIQGLVDKTNSDE